MVLAWTWAGTSHAAELFTLSPENHAEAAPHGKETDAVWGDYVLRNDRIVAVIADPQLMVGRSGSRKWGFHVAGNVIDLARRDASGSGAGDLLVGYDAAYGLFSRRSVWPADVPDEPHRQEGFTDPARAHEREGREPREAESVTLELPGQEVIQSVRYTLADGDDGLTVEVTLVNRGNQPIAIPMREIPAALDMGPHLVAWTRHFLWGYDPELRLSYVYDPWFGGAYGVLDDHPGGAGLPVRRPVMMISMSAPDDAITLRPRQTRVIRRQLIPARDLFHLRDLAPAARRGLAPGAAAVLRVQAEGEPIPGALVTLRAGDDLYAAGRTDADGRITTELPRRTFKLRVEPPGSAAVERSWNLRDEPELTVAVDAPAVLETSVTDAAGAAMPARISLRGIGDTPTPFLFPDTGEHVAHHMLALGPQPLRQPIPPGDYEATITRGPAWTAVARRITLEPGRTTPLHVALERVMDATGWIAADLGNRSTVSRPFSTASVAGRVLDLASSGIDFAPATERDHAWDYTPTIEALGLTPFLKSAGGVGLTQRVRKTWTHQNAFPVAVTPGAPDGGAPQRHQHILQVPWLARWGADIAPGGNLHWAGDEKLIQVTPPGIWPNDGRSDGEDRLFRPWLTGPEQAHRNGRLNVLRFYDAMELQPLSDFLDLPEWNPDDPRNQADLDAWQADLDRRRRENWPNVTGRNLRWLQMLQMGYRITGVANSNALHNAAASGRLRTWILSPTDDPEAIQPLDVARALLRGHAVMSTGPLVQLAAAPAGEGRRVIDGKPVDFAESPRGWTVRFAAQVGDTVAVDSAGVTLHVRVQAPDQAVIDRIQILRNGRPDPRLTIDRATQPERFRDGAVQFEEAITIDDVGVDTFFIVLATGEGPRWHASNMRTVDNPRDPAPAPEPRIRHVAMTNPIYVAVEGPTYKPHSPVFDETYTLLEVTRPVPTADDAPVGELTLRLFNDADAPVSDSFSVSFQPEGMVTVEGDNRFAYKLAPGETTTIRVPVRGRGQTGERVIAWVERSSVGVGRRPAGVRVTLDGQADPYDGWDARRRNEAAWRPDHVATRPDNWHAWRDHQRGRPIPPPQP